MPINRSRFARVARITPLLVAIAVAFSAQAGSALAASPHAAARQLGRASEKAAASKKAHASQVLPAQGMFDNCSLGTELSTCEQDLQQMHQAGLQVAVVGIQGDSLETMSSFAAYAQSIGMSVMWELNDPGFWGGAWEGASAAADWQQFGAACGCSDTTQILDYMIQWLSALPGTYGYYAADDWTLTAGQAAGLRQYVNEIKSVDPNHMVMVGSTQAQGTTYYATGATIGNEIYPETTASLMPAGSNLAAWQSVQDSVTQDQRAAASAGTPSAFILQAFTFGDNIYDGEAVGVCTPNMSQEHCASLLQYPDAAVQLELRNEVLQRAHPKLILWYTFSEASQGSRWSALSSVVQAPFPAVASAARAKHSKSRHVHPHRRPKHRHTKPRRHTRRHHHSG